MQFSANLGFLWSELTLPNAIRAAGAAGFDAVEMHWPYDTPSEDVRAALAQTGLRCLGLNTIRGDVAAGENGLAALPGRGAEARAAVDQAAAYAREIGAGAIHVMAGFAQGAAAHEAFVATLRHALEAAPDQVIVIEPLNRHDAPGYFLQTTDQARAIIEEVGDARLRLMFDCYHVGRNEGDVTTRLRDLAPIIGHIQFASVPERAAPDRGELAYGAVFATIRELGWPAPLGAEYKPCGPTEPTLGWLARARAGTL